MILMSLNLSKRKKKIIFFGETINELDMKPGGYISWFIDAMKEVGEEDQYQILQSVQPDESIEDLVLRLNEHVLLKDAHTIILHAGLTDYLQAITGATENTRWFIQQFSALLNQMLEHRKMRVIVCLPSLYLKNLEPGLHYHQTELNTIISQIAAERNLEVIDLDKIVLETAAGRESNIATSITNQAIGTVLWKVFKLKH